ncbi:flagellar M-ring protein FliF [Agrobacterium sp. SHOUNA12C]|uniref:Flagellar M-ring protein n=1 Tax=Rhizobium rhizogenes (strain K84 / ATCC BAA-868) TaxID=311403 RepID=B9J952_RHIR8|nr:MULTISPECIES: flagellar basal-body MS-ring/collar protein FliF [Rhizobium]ACM25454.1 flagellar M-ring protein [Rhizobium rhizogenes K84]KAA6486813.1 flagellar M-ring protein FliF [Agrobacterium sp. ICMP 7243]MCJ9722424.1 flagellar M-ring protein FliF [Agrobacterium sp. BETTINA12B]MCJ9757543.1 flagellar M-ring protein FliF [Agrobacterium sp. SHOUNA12C]OCI98073.1 flagellar M-ring protein FliF [Agrobacterium sp. 13-626]OCJ21798.1 flagellar M-ring protein FliF [Agrobacterium sp. B131/95]OCJ26
MNLLNQLVPLFRNLQNLGRTRLLTLAGVGILSVALVLFAALYVNKPAQETLYVGLDATDLNQISIALAEAKINFQVGADGTSLTVPTGMTGKARALLAERGLPNSTNAGYELFDNVGSLGLTSFMQEVTRVRALEGEIGRTITSISGISAARVHIVMQDVGNFRKADQKPTASVMIRANAEAARKAAQAIRHLVASAVPGLEVDDVTILDSTGQLLASGDDQSNGALNRNLGIVQNVQGEIASNIDKALAPFLGMDNFRSSVTAQLNTDSQQVQETTYDPESKVERSVRTTKEAQKSQQRQSDTAATVEQNIPQAAPQAGGNGPTSNDQTDKREEQTNYEINSKTTATVRNSYRIEKLSVAVVVNRGRIAQMVGQPADPAKVDAYIAEMQKIVATAAGLDPSRGDVVTVNAMDFLDTQLLDDNASGLNIMDVLSRNIAGIINSLAFVAVAVLIIWLGFRPLIRSLGGGANGTALPDAAGLELPDFAPGAVGGPGAALMDGFGSDFGFDSTDDLLTMGEDNSTFNRRVKEGPERRLSRMVEISEERAAKILRKWAVDKAA